MAGKKLTSEQLFMAFPLLRYYVSETDEDGSSMPPELMGSEVFEK